MARTPLLQHLERAAAELAADGNGSWQTTRAGLLKKAGLAGLGVAGLSRLTAPARAASSTSIVVVGAGLAGLTCAYRLKQAGYRAQIHEASTRLGGRCWSGRGVLRRRPGLRARRGAHRPGPQRDPQSRARARSRPRQPAPGRGQRHRGARVLRRSAVHVRRHVRRPEADLAEAPLGPLGRELSDPVRQLHAARVRPRPHVHRRLDRGVGPGRHGLAARSAARRRLQHRVRRRVERAELAQPRLPARLPGPGPAPYLRQVEREVPRARRERPDRVRSRRCARGPDHDRLGARLREEDAGWADTRSASSRARRRSPSPPTCSCWRCRSRSCGSSVDLSQSGFSAPKLQAIAELGMGTNSKLHVQFTRRHWSRPRLER